MRRIESVECPWLCSPSTTFGSGGRLTSDFQAGQIISGLDLGLSQECSDLSRKHTVNLRSWLLQLIEINNLESVAQNFLASQSCFFNFFCWSMSFYAPPPSPSSFLLPTSLFFSCGSRGPKGFDEKFALLSLPRGRPVVLAVVKQDPSGPCVCLFSGQRVRIRKQGSEGCCTLNGSLL